MTDQLLLTVPQAAYRLGISRSLAYKLVQRQVLVSITIGRARRIPVRALDAFVAEQLALVQRGKEGE